MHDSPVIAAISTPPGRGAIAVVRVSGAGAHDVARALIEPFPDRARVATLAAARDPRSGETIDQVVVTRYDAPRSYTGEDMVEMSGHGGFAAPAALLDALLAAGARLAEPGEFTRRAVLAGKMDLVQAEAVGDLVDARSDAMRRAAVAQLDGGLSRRIGALRERLLELEALLAYDIDFPEEDDGPIPRARVTAAAEDAERALEALLATARAGALVREGAVVVIAGAPNAGKSSLFNALLGERRAIVTEVPGTTRDAIEATLDHAGWPIRLVDTAGLRATADLVERLGIEVSERYLAGAHAVIACGEDATTLAATLARVSALTDAPVIASHTKLDLVSSGNQIAAADAGTIGVSSETGEGLEALLDALTRRLEERYGALEPAMPVLTRTRHARAVAEARGEMTSFLEAWRDGSLPAPVAAVHVRQALHALEELVGAVDVEEVLGRVFSAFCVGK